MAVVLTLAGTATSRAADLAWSVRTWQIDDGSNNGIVGIAQSPDGYLWIATMAGLNRFDGLRFEHHIVGSLFRAPDVNVRGILASRDGGLWVVLDNAVVLLQRNKSPVIARDNIPSLRFDSMAEDHQGALWIGFRSNVICRVKDGKATVFSSDAGIPRGYTTSLTVDNDGQVWLAVGSQIGIFRDGRFVRKTAMPEPATITRASGGGIWIFAGLSLYRFQEGGSLEMVGSLPLPRQMSTRNATSLMPFEDRQGTVWIGTLTNGLYRFVNSGFERVPTPQVRITVLAEDNEGNLWVGTDAGVDRLSPRAIEVEGSEDTQQPPVQTICQAKDGSIWATMADGDLRVRNDNRWKPAPFKFKGDANVVAADPQGAIWMGTGNRRLYEWESGQLKVWDESKGMNGHSITALLPVPSGDLWICSTAPDAIERWHEGHLTPYQLPSKKVHRIDAVARDRDGNTWMGWVGTRMTDGGILEITPDDHIIDQQASSGINWPVQSLCATDDNMVLIGCRTGGLGWVKRGAFGVITTQQGIYDDDITEIVADGLGWVWFGSSHGIFRIRQRELRDFADGKNSRVQSVYYGPDERLPDLQGIRGTASALRTQDGRIWMAMATGLAIIHPDRIGEGAVPPQVHIERAIVDDKTVASVSSYFPDESAGAAQPGGVLNLPPDYRRLEFDFTALTFTSPQNARFRYRLDGFDEDWTEASEPRQAIYPRLPAGNYRFRVVGRSADGNWSPDEAAMSVKVAPFIWQMWWFQVGAVALFGLVILVLVRYLSFRWLRRRLEIAERRSALDRERDRIARDIHDDLGHGLTQIVLLSELTLHNHLPTDERQDHLEQIVTTAKQGLRSLDETVWAINPRNDTLPDLVDYLGHFVMKSLATANIKCRLHLPDYPPNRPVPAEVRHSLFLVVKEAVNNIICHANATSVKMSIQITDEDLIMVIEDDGQGFAFGESAPGQDGLLNMRQRMSDIGGKFEIESAPGAGTRISLTHPWNARTRMARAHLEN